MNRFWVDILNPIFNLINPETIVEIRADSGTNTRNILNYCVFNDSKLISIDPSPKFDVNQFKEEYGDKFQMVLDLSLNYIPKLEKCDVILIDGDSNWYTVYNELKLLEKNFDYDSFPLIFLQNVSRPYGRRDLYYNPDSIPSEFLQEFKKLGMAPNQSELLLEGEINHNLNNALADNTPKNGVLTAIEDFLGETELNLSFYKINGFNGLGIIYFEDDSFNEKLNNIVYESEIGETVEKFYISNSIKKNNFIDYQKNHILNLETKLSQYEREIQKLNCIIQVYKEQIDNLNHESENLFEKVDSLQKSNGNLIAERDSLIDRNFLLSKSNADLITKKDSLSAEITKLNNINTELITEKETLLKNLKDSEELNSRLSSDNDILLSKKKSWKKFNNYLFEKIKDLNNNNTELNNINTELITEKDTLSAEITKLNNINTELITEKDTLIDNNFLLSKSNADLIDKRDSLIDRNVLLSKSNADLIAERDSLMDYNVLLSKSNADLIAERDSVINRNLILTKSKKELLIENDNLKNQSESLLNSNSWKFTSPLRRTMKIFKK